MPRVSLDYYPDTKAKTREDAVIQLCINKVINDHKCGNCYHSDKFYTWILRKVEGFFNKKQPKIIEDEGSPISCFCYLNPKVIDKGILSRCSFWKDYR